MLGAMLGGGRAVLGAMLGGGRAVLGAMFGGGRAVLGGTWSAVLGRSSAAVYSGNCLVATTGGKGRL